MAHTPGDRGTSDTGRMLTVAQVAEYLQLNRLTVYRYIREGKIPAAKIGKLYRVLKADVDRFLEARKVGSPTATRRQATGVQRVVPSAAAARQRSPEEVYVGPNWRERLRDRENVTPGYPLEWVMRGPH